MFNFKCPTKNWIILNLSDSLISNVYQKFAIILNLSDSIISNFRLVWLYDFKYSTKTFDRLKFDRLKHISSFWICPTLWFQKFDDKYFIILINSTLILKISDKNIWLFLWVRLYDFNQWKIFDHLYSFDTSELIIECSKIILRHYSVYDS